MIIVQPRTISQNSVWGHAECRVSPPSRMLCARVRRRFPSASILGIPPKIATRRWVLLPRPRPVAGWLGRSEVAPAVATQPDQHPGSGVSPFPSQGMESRKGRSGNLPMTAPGIARWTVRLPSAATATRPHPNPVIPALHDSTC